MSINLTVTFKAREAQTERAARMDKSVTAGDFNSFFQ